MAKILVEVDDQALARAAAKLGTTTKKDTIGRALEHVNQDAPDDGAASRAWDEWADSVGDRVAEVDWAEAWR